MAERYTFLEHLEHSIMGIITGLISGLFFALYLELKPQFPNTLTLFGVIFFVVLFYFVLAVGLSFGVIKYIRYLRLKESEKV